MAVLKIGVFFDGTGNNARNYLMKQPRKEVAEEKDAEVWGQDQEAQAFKECYEAHAIVPEDYKKSNKQTSYNTPPTNIWHLYNHYKSGRTSQGYQLGVYVSGCGTEDGKEDDLIAMAAGWSLKPDWSGLWFFGGRDTGVKNKASSAVKLIKDQIKKSIKEMEGFTFDSIEFEIFGFSRGATTARHFANRHASGDKDLIKALKSAGLDKKLYPNIETNPLGVINVIGLFDSVAAILALSKGSVDLSDSNTGSINIDLKDSVAKNVFHITAGHELRYNFSLNRTLPAHTRELELAGAHSDIGGGYHEDVEEGLFITKPNYSFEHKDCKNDGSKAHSQAEAMRNNLLAHPRWGPLLQKSRVEIVDFERREAGSNKLVGSAVELKRSHVKTGLELIALNAMRDYCVKAAGCIFHRFGYDADLSPGRIPEDLVAYRDTVYREMSCLNDMQKGHSAMSALAPELAAKYVHCSFYWGESDSVVDAEKSVSKRSIPNTFLFNVLLTSRPTDDYVRLEYNANGENLKK